MKYLKRQLVKGEDGVTRKTHRNDQCPCGKKKIRVYRAANGSVIKEEETKNKFKHCCLMKEGEQAGTVLSSHDQLKLKRQHKGWPMRQYLEEKIGITVKKL